MMARTKKGLQREQTPTSSNFSTPLSNEEETALAHVIINIVKEELQAHEAALQEIASFYVKVADERLEKLSGEVRYITKSLDFTPKQLEDETKVIKKHIETLQKI